MLWRFVAAVNQILLGVPHDLAPALIRPLVMFHDSYGVQEVFATNLAAKSSIESLPITFNFKFQIQHRTKIQ